MLGELFEIRIGFVGWAKAQSAVPTVPLAMAGTLRFAHPTECAAAPYSAICRGREGPASGRSSMTIMQSAAQPIIAAAAAKT